MIILSFTNQQLKIILKLVKDNIVKFALIVGIALKKTRTRTIEPEEPSKYNPK